MSAQDPRPSTGDPESDRMWEQLRAAEARQPNAPREASPAWRAAALAVGRLTGDGDRHGRHIAERLAIRRIADVIEGGAPGACCFYADAQLALMGLRARDVSREQVAAFVAAVLDLFDHPDTRG